VTVFVLTYCQDLSTLYGSTLIFKSLRIGFPTAEVHVVDNNSIPEAQQEIRARAAEQGGVFHSLPTTQHHFQVLHDLSLDPTREGRVILLHPDLCFWEDCERWKFDALIAGRVIPAFVDVTNGGIIMPHLHSQFWWIEDARRFREVITREYAAAAADPLCGFVPFYSRENGGRRKYEIGAGLYATFADQIHAFTAQELDCYDHLIAGTYSNFMIALLRQQADDTLLRAFMETHEYAKGDYEQYRQLRGNWRKQQQYYDLLSHENFERLPSSR
jgi:hypothetical protein